MKTSSGDPHLPERQGYEEIEYPRVGIEWLYGMPWRLSDSPGSVRTPAPTLGQHNEHVLGQLLGLLPEELERLQEAEVVY